MKYFLIAIVVAGLLIDNNAIASVASKLLKEGGGEAIEYGTKSFAKRTAKKAALREISEKFGIDTAEVVTRVASRYGKDPDEFATQVLRYKKWLSLSGDQLEVTVDFAARTGRKGAFLINRFGFNNLYSNGWMKTGAEKPIEEAWRIVDPYAIGGSWKRLRMAMTHANINGSGRDFCELLFENRASAGRIPGFVKGDKIFSGHIGDKRQGLDFIAPSPNGKLRIIEFSTGEKPAFGNQNQMSWEWIRKNLAEYVENADANTKINLRSAGFPFDKLTVSNLNDPKFPLENYVSREIYAPEINTEAVHSLLGKDVKTIILD